MTKEEYVRSTIEIGRQTLADFSKDEETLRKEFVLCKEVAKAIKERKRRKKNGH